MKPIGHLSSLFPMADTIEQLFAKCTKCIEEGNNSEKAAFTPMRKKVIASRRPSLEQMSTSSEGNT
ncbi:hypothetical protein ACI3PL_31265, partial [Lacticaseibacillus paracasei]